MATVTYLQDRPRVRASRPKLKVLISAYACEPERGSEPGIGWQWATRLAELGHEIFVITRANNREAIERAQTQKPISTLHFVYVDLPRWASFWKRGGRGVHLYYFLWQCLAYRLARDLHRCLRFDLVHHLTFGVFRQPSLLGFLGAPFIFGPVGGGERAPSTLRQTLPPLARVREWIRDAANVYAKFDPLLRLGLKRTAKILCKTAETRDCIPRMYREQCELFLEVGTDRSTTPIAAHAAREAGMRVLYVGRFVHMKGLHLALPAFKQLHAQFPESRLTLVGSGPQESELRELASKLEIDHAIDWPGWVSRDRLPDIYSSHSAFLFPSLHDSSGNAVLEAMARGLPIVCLNRGGPAALIDAFSGIAIDADEPDAAISRLGDALLLLARRPELRLFLSRGAQIRANSHFSWSTQVRRMNALYYSLQDRQAAT